MANSRLERIGTIYSRVTGLLRSEAVKLENKPLWYDVYQAFPPKFQPRFDRPTPNINIPKIFYPEDIIRARIKKEHPALLNAVNLSDQNRLSNVQKCLVYYKEFKENDLSDDEAFQKAIDRVTSEIPMRRTEREKSSTQPSMPSVAEEFKRSKNLVKDIFKE